MLKVNRLIRDMKRNADQRLLFPSWGGISLDQLCVATWTDASNHNRPDRGSTIGIVTGIAPKQLLHGEECQISIVQWKSGRTPRQCLGSNGAEVQALTIGEDQNFQIRGLLLEFSGVTLDRNRLHEQVAQVPGVLIMDSKGIFDAATRNLSALHGLRESRAGYELTLAVLQAVKAGTVMRWVCGLAQLADSLTKADRKTFLQFLSQKQHWRLVDDETFTAGKKLGKRKLEQMMRERESLFVAWVKTQAETNGWPWLTDEEEVQYTPFD